MIQPAFLQSGDTVLIVNPSGYIPFEKLEQAKSVLTSWGYKVEFGANTQKEQSYFAGSDVERLHDLQWAFNHPNAKLIIMGRGGYGLSRIIDQIDFSFFNKHPKWICGFSDVTVLHSHIVQNWNITTIHGPMCGAFAQETLVMPHMDALQNIFQGIQTTIKSIPNKYNKLGTAQGRLVGGNLCMLAHLTGSKDQLITDNTLLFIEDIGEHLYKIDRMLYTLKRSGQLSKIKGLVCGNFTDMEDTVRPFGQNIYEIILSHFDNLSIPIVFDMPIGHETLNYPIVLGMNYVLHVSGEDCLLQPLNYL